MATIEQRIERLESQCNALESDLSLMLDDELEKRIDVLLELMGTNRKQVIAEHRSLQNFAATLRQQVEQEKHIHGDITRGIESNKNGIGYSQ